MRNFQEFRQEETLFKFGNFLFFKSSQNWLYKFSALDKPGSMEKDLLWKPFIRWPINFHNPQRIYQTLYMGNVIQPPQKLFFINPKICLQITLKLVNAEKFDAETIRCHIVLLG